MKRKSKWSVRAVGILACVLTVGILSPLGSLADGLDPVVTGGITGTVVDVHGNGVRDANIIIRRTDGTMVASAGADNSGGYARNGLAPGAYIVEFNAWGYAKQWFNGRDTAEAADPVTVVDQQQTTGVDAVLVAASTHGTISGLVTDNQGQPLEGIEVMGSAAEPGSEAMAVTNATGHYVTNPVVPDTYKVSFRDPANRYVVQYYDNQPTWEMANPVTVVAGADTPGINAATDPIPPPAPVLTEISVAPSESSLLSGGSQQFTAVGHYDNATSADITSTLTWTSTDPAVATITSAGFATAVDEGVTTVVAATGPLSGSTSLTVLTSAPEPGSAPVSPESGGTVTVNPSPTPDDPVGTTVAVPGGTAGGTVSVTVEPATGEAPAGYSFAGREILISAPEATWDNPLRLTFVLDASAVPEGLDHTGINVFRNEALVEECAGSTTAVPPDAGEPAGRPCVSDRQTLGSGTVQLTVLAPLASRWNLGVPLDRTPPQVIVTSPRTSIDYLLGEAVAADYHCVDLGPGSSGVATCTGSVPDGAFLDTGTVGTKSFAVSTSDNTGNEATVHITYRVTYAFSASSGPFASPGTVFVAKAGKDISLLFGLDGDQGLDVLAPGSPTSTQISCATGGARSALKQNADAKTSSLRFVAPTATYEYEWATPKTWAGTCREFRMTLRDGTEHTAEFQFT